MSSPSALAALRLMTSSNLVGNSTGRSPGFSPLSMGRHRRRHGDKHPCWACPGWAPISSACQCASHIIAPRLDSRFNESIEILQMRKLFNAGFHLDVVSVEAGSALQCEQAAKLKYGKPQFFCAIDRLAEFCLDFLRIRGFHMAFDQSIDAKHLWLEPAICPAGNQRKSAIARLLRIFDISLLPLCVSQNCEMTSHRKPKLNRLQLVDRLFQHGNAMFEVTLLA